MSLLGNFRALFKSKKVDVRTRYEFLREAVSGTMSKFYMARDRETERIVGVKILDTKKTAEFDARFKGLKKPTEGEITAAMDHPRIVKLYEYGVTTADEQFLVLEFLEGQGLNSLLLAKSQLLAGRQLDLLRQAAQALEAVHKAGYIHRDVCPRNFIASPEADSMKLIDFGLAVPATPPFMQPGNRTGNPNYMAPELIKRQSTDHRVDVFAFGIMAYELLTFELPWSRGLTGKAAMDHATKPPTEITRYRPKINAKLADAIGLCLEQEPARRCPSMAQFLRAIHGLKNVDQG